MNTNVIAQLCHILAHLTNVIYICNNILHRLIVVYATVATTITARAESGRCAVGERSCALGQTTDSCAQKAPSPRLQAVRRRSALAVCAMGLFARAGGRLPQRAAQRGHSAAPARSAGGCSALTTVFLLSEYFPIYHLS